MDILDILDILDIMDICDILDILDIMDIMRRGRESTGIFTILLGADTDCRTCRICTNPDKVRHD
jgi:hypothetical protein